METYSHLLEQYRTLWNNRLLSGENHEQVLKEAIISQLKDENSHPRVRKNIHEKYYLAIKRISDSELSLEDQLLLIKLHTELMESQLHS